MSESSRRDFLIKAAQGTALAATGGLIWWFLLQNQARATPFVIRPPGAGTEAEFNALRADVAALRTTVANTLATVFQHITLIR